MGMRLKRIRLLRVFSNTYWQVQAQYRFGSVLWMINGILTPLILMALWTLIAAKGELVLNQSQVFTYYFLSMIVFRLTQSWVAEDLTFTIREGRFAKYLLRPTSFLTEWIAKDFALKLIRLITLIPLVLLVIAISPYKLSLDMNWTMWFLAIGAVIIGYLINLLIETIVGISTFWLDDAYGTFLLLMLIRDIFSGILVPIALMPQYLANISRVLPFYTQLGFPIDLMMGRVSIVQGMILITQAGAWLLGLTLLFFWYFHYTINKYSADGL